MNNQANLPLEIDSCGVGFIYRPNPSHSVIRDSLTALRNLEHRGAVGADGESGDGAGILCSVPFGILEAEGWSAARIGAVGMIFLPPSYAAFCRSMTEHFLLEEGFVVEGWRTVPIDLAVLGPSARDTAPLVEQVIIAPSEGSEHEIEHRLFAARRKMTNYLWSQPFGTDYFVCSLSMRTVVYKAMVQSPVLPEFYPDLVNPLFESSFSVFHRRFSTNTNPRWWLAQPFRLLGHNGEINTLSGNRIWARAKQALFEQNQLTSRTEPVLHPSGSDSANLDNMLELLCSAGFSPESSLMRLIPPAPSAHSGAIADFYEYHAPLQEPWDGPALVVYSDGRSVGAILDRNGLRPARYTRMHDGSFILCSETGVIDIAEEEIAERGRLGPGQMVCVDLATGRLFLDHELKETVAARYPYGTWLKEERISFDTGDDSVQSELPARELRRVQLSVGYGLEDLEHLKCMSETGKEPVFSMGDDTALPLLSAHPRLLFDYFKQRFAQVTNPSIDSLRERLVMSLDTYLGSRWRGLIPHREAARVARCSSPILTEKDLEKIASGLPYLSVCSLSINAPKDSFDIDVELDRICAEAADAVSAGATLVVLSDRGLTEKLVPVPVLAAVGALHHYLIARGLRLNCAIVVETAQCWSPHQFACLLGYGAQAICPYLAYESVRHLMSEEPVRASAKVTPSQALTNYRQSIEKALLKIMAKMGISTLSSYIGAQIFECIGLTESVVNRCFIGTASHVGGLSLIELATDMLRFLDTAEQAVKMVDYGLLRHRKGGEFHGNNPEVVKALHLAVGARDQNLSAGERAKFFEQYSRLVEDRQAANVRDLFALFSDRQPISIDEVESEQVIVKRFCTGGMSLGALSPEAHETLAVAMNRLGGASNSGEGGEDPRRYRSIVTDTENGASPTFPGVRGLRTGDTSASKIRQVASGRFGVTPEYLVTAEQIEIKIAQGAKPGEGGQLPGDKVSEYIGQLRRAQPGTTLISPPPHHDIYSIEDLAQLIFDLHQVNPVARVSVKLVSSSGIGTIAAGVAKAKADIIQVSGHEGGTGASPVSSIRHAGLPWEIGLSEAHQNLVANGLRDRIVLRVDGGLRTGADVVVAALLGAEEYGFGSIALVAAGCIMARVCHTNNCPAGVASQKASLREKFTGTPDQIENLLLFIAEEVRFILADLGYRSLTELVGRIDLLSARADVKVPKGVAFDVSNILSGRIYQKRPSSAPEKSVTLDDAILADESIQNAIANHTVASKVCSISNRDRATGAKLSGYIARLHGDEGFGGQLTIKLDGTAGQSFGAFNIRSVRLILTGEANDYVGKGMNGGTVVVRPSVPKPDFTNDVLAGNACLYGATGGALYCAGAVGERFAVRNAGAFAVVEGSGDHCCEYMTGGAVVVIGSTGRNFGAGMTGGVSYVLDSDDTFMENLSPDGGLRVARLAEKNEEALKRLIRRHLKLTGSSRARVILERWSEYRHLFWQVVPSVDGAPISYPYKNAPDGTAAQA
ncbi:MAG: glutamate synthase large subunit [Candidatus Obscuribacterales bacterium]|nr:glutamate synthase large subunit [Candidatus Obscuribacterales bacterium]